MYYFPTPNLEERTAWRSASEVQAAAIEHEKRRYQMIQELSLAKPQVITKGQKQSGWAAALQAVLLFLSVK